MFISHYTIRGMCKNNMANLPANLPADLPANLLANLPLRI